ncbi:MAG: alpha/beta hydrolase [Deltaproteobacteria bacterium]|nr:alpha/beta hydrolase [Deltaproteobacteria bacterium]
MNIKHLILILVVCMIAATLGCTSLGMNTIPMDKLKAKYADVESKIIEIDGMNIHYKDEGQGPVLILLHGVCASLHTWDGWTERLKGHYRVIRLDIPGFGLTGPAPDPSLYKIDEAVNLFEKIVNEMKLKKFYLAGNSLGGYIAWNYTLKNPNKVEKLILVDSVGFPQPLPGLLAFASNPVIRPFARHIMPRFMFDSAVKQVYGDKSKVTQELKDRYFELAMREGNKGSYVDVFTEMRKLCKNENLSAGIKDLQPPTLIMWGTKDTWIPFKYFENWKKELPTAKFIQYEGAGHTPMEEIPDMTAHDADLFLSGK